MLFELHVTIEGEDVERWSDFCRTADAKPLFIELSSGEYPRQLMFAATTDRSLDDALEWMKGQEDAVYQAGFNPLRKKLECPLDKSFRASCLPINPVLSYSECHMKLMLLGADNWDGLSLTPQVLEYGIVGSGYAHASRNLLAVEDGWQKYYLTRRMYGDHEPREAARDFAQAYERVNRCIAPVRMEMERVLLDSAPELDKGWA